MLSGGPNNPFPLLYLSSHYAYRSHFHTPPDVGARTAGMPLLRALILGLSPDSPIGDAPSRREPSLHLIGMWVGFAIALLLVALFSGKISELLREREESLLRRKEELAKKDRLAALGTPAPVRPTN
jgi:hypothetical protein